MQKPIVTFKPVRKIGESYYLLLPKEWFETYNITLPDENIKVELLIVADTDIHIINPSHSDEVYKEVTKIMRGSTTHEVN